MKNTTCHIQYVKSVAVFLAMLVLTLPFYSANAYASLRITKNSGNDNIDGFVDAQGDKWTLEVEAAIPGETITGPQLTMNGYPFQSSPSKGVTASCVQNPGGLYGCSYIVDFMNRVIPESTVPIDVKLFKQDGTLSDRDTSKSISFDGSAPLISALAVSQKTQDVEVSFTVKDRPDNCVGLKSIEFFEDSTSLNVLEGSALDAKISRKCGDNSVTERMPLSSSTASRTIKVVATDKLGHAQTLSRNLFFDGEAPVINASSFKSGDFGRFVPGGIINAQLSITAKEEGNVLFGTAKSTALGLQDTEVACVKATGAVHNVFTCRWDVHADFSQGFTVEMTVRDGAGRTDTETFTSSVTADTTRPVVDYFGAERQHSGVNYAGKNATIVARFIETESGMGKTHVAADLHELSARFGRRVYVHECTEANGVWSCYWRGLDVTKSGRIALVDAEDNVGNPAQNMRGADIVLDILAPDIVEESVVVNPSLGEEGIYQSRDTLEIAFDVVEANGLFLVTIDESGIVEHGGVGEVSCPLKQGSGDTYHCTYITDSIKSGPVDNAVFTIRAEDTAGNWAEADKAIEILGRDQETAPAFWSVKKVACSPNGLDINTMKLINQRVFCTVEFKTNADVALISTTLSGCTGDTAQLEDTFMIGNFGGNTKPGIMLEFKVLSDDDIGTLLNADVALNYECTLRLLTKRGNAVIQQLEQEKANISVTLFETAFGRELRTIEDRIEDAKDKAENDLFKLVGTLNKILRLVQTLCSLLPVLQALFFAYDAIDAGLDGLRDLIITEPIAATYCAKAVAVESYKGKGIVDMLQMLCSFASCTPNSAAIGIGGPVGAYAQWQKDVLDRYNQWTFSSSLGIAAKATSLTDNAVLSAAGLCLPGIIFNLEKMRQIQCRYVGCLENDVKAGVATVESCRELKDYQECKYIYGEVFQIIPFVGAIDQLLGVLKSFVTDPASWVDFAFFLFCGETWCSTSGSARGVCNFFSTFVYLMGVIESVISGFEQMTTTTKADYCSQVL